MPITCKQIAEMAGVSRQAAASVLNHARVCLVSPEKRETILRLARELHYVGSNTARTLARGRSGLVGIMTGGLDKSVTAHSLIALDVELRSCGLLPVVIYTRSEAHCAAEGIQSLIRQHVDGIFVNNLRNPAVAELRETGLTNLVPTVFLDTGGTGDVHELVVDPVPGFHQAAAALRRRKVRTLHAFIHATPLPEEPLEIACIRQLAGEFGGEVHPAIDYYSVLDPRRDMYRGMDRMYEILRLLPPCDALFFDMEMAAAGAVALLNSRGWRIPRETAVFCFNGCRLSSCFTPTLSTIKYQPEAFATEAVKLLRRVMEDPATPPVRENIPAEFIARESLF